MKYCPRCLRSASDDKSYCYTDGTELAQDPKCLKCGKPLSPHDKFCAYCGMEAGKL